MVKRRTQLGIKIDRSLTQSEFGLLERIEPDVVAKMLRQRVHLTNHTSKGVSRWLADNTSAYYHQPSPSEVWFESEDDLVLFIAAFQGK